MSKCDCRICQEHRQIEKAIADRDVDALIRMVRHQADVLAAVETEVEYYEAILQGRWEGGQDMLEAALALYKE